MQNNTISVGNPNDLFPIILHDGAHVVDSRLIAEALGVNHADWFRNVVLKYKDDIEAKFSLLRFENGAVKVEKGRGIKHTRFCYLDEDQAIFIATLSRNTPQVIAFKAKLVLSFAELKKDFSKIYALWHELTQNLEKDDAQHDANIEAIEKAFQFVLNKCASLGANIADLETEVTNLRKEQKTTAQTLESLSKELKAQQAQIASLQNTQIQEKNVVENTVERVDKIEETLGFKAVAYIYIIFCPRRRWYKIGSSHNTKGRKKAFDVIDANLVIILEIPVFSRDEAYNQETTLKKRFITKHRQGEWYALDENDLAYLKSLEQSNIKHLMQMA